MKNDHERLKNAEEAFDALAPLVIGALVRAMRHFRRNRVTPSHRELVSAVVLALDGLTKVLLMRIAQFDEHITLGTCEVCGADDELRPYGPDGKSICRWCAHDGHGRLKPAAEAAMTEHIRSLDGAVMLNDGAPRNMTEEELADWAERNATRGGKA